MAHPSITCPILGNACHKDFAEVANISQTNTHASNDRSHDAIVMSRQFSRTNDLWLAWATDRGEAYYAWYQQCGRCGKRSERRNGTHTCRKYGKMEPVFVNNSATDLTPLYPTILTSAEYVHAEEFFVIAKLPNFYQLFQQYIDKSPQRQHLCRDLSFPAPDADFAELDLLQKLYALTNTNNHDLYSGETIDFLHSRISNHSNTSIPEIVQMIRSGQYKVTIFGTLPVRFTIKIVENIMTTV